MKIPVVLHVGKLSTKRRRRPCRESRAQAQQRQRRPDERQPLHPQRAMVHTPQRSRNFQPCQFGNDAIMLASEPWHLTASIGSTG